MTVQELYRSVLQGLPSPLDSVVLYLVNWVFQGLLFADNTERFAKLILEVLVFVPAFTALRKRGSTRGAIAGGVFVSHTINWILATNIHSTRAKGKQGEASGLEEIFTPPVLRIRLLLEHMDCIHSSCIYGSLARGEAHSESDIDIHLYRRSGSSNYIQANLVLFCIRTMCNIRGYPVDVWVRESVEKEKPMPEEQPIIIHDHENILKSEFRDYTTIVESSYFSDKV